MKVACKTLGPVLVLALALACGESMAQSYPSRPIAFVVGFAPGGGTDVTARIIGKELAERLGQPVIVDNKPGAAAIIATEFVAKAAPDGYTLLAAASGQMVYNPGVYASLPYDPAKSFIPITLFNLDPLVFAVHPSVPATSIKEYVALAKAKPGALFYSSAAVAGEVSVIVMSIPPILAQLRAGKLRALAINGPSRSRFMPDIPTALESGLDFEGNTWSGLFAPAGTPRAIIDKLYGELSIVLNSDSMKERFAALGQETAGMGMPPAEFDAFFRAELAKWTKVGRDLNIRAD